MAVIGAIGTLKGGHRTVAVAGGRSWRSLAHWFHHGEVRRQFNLEQRGINRLVEHHVGKIVAQAGAVGKFQLGNGDRKIVGAKSRSEFHR